MIEPRGDDGRDDVTDGSPHRPAGVPVVAERFVRLWPDVQALESDGGLPDTDRCNTSGDGVHRREDCHSCCTNGP